MNPDKIRKHHTELVDSSSIRKFACGNLNIQTGFKSECNKGGIERNRYANVPLYYEIILTSCNLQTKQMTKLVNLYSVLLFKTELVWKNLLTNVPALQRTV